MRIPYGRQNITDADLSAVREALHSEYLTQGPTIDEFEKNFAQYVGSNYAVAVSNGTAALHLCAMALNVEAGQKVITTPITFAASANCVRYAGGEVVFCDIDPETYLMDLDKLESMLSAKPKGYYKGIIPVDFAGLMVDLEKVRAIADAYGCWVVEDSCHAPGAHFIDSKGQKIMAGSGVYSDASIFSFHPVKHIACGEGGMVTTNREDLAKSIQLLRAHGITKDPDLMGVNDGPWYYEMVKLGFNYRLTDIQAALGISQLSRLDWSLEERNKLAVKYHQFFDAKGWKHQSVSEGYFNAHHLYVIQHPDRKALFHHLKAHSIYPQIHYIPVHSMPYYQSLGWKPEDLPLAMEYYSQCISLPMYPSLKEGEFNYVLETLDTF
ncbi:UDP-4-amino-4,6-dideoxy-N-acetyl-beta-L-altrosamine transaminase [Akkermansiaceae bacterium]|nr:UDP-4-amino-4,6-dideoxy-N-acetyl-beta-L-altrosamine transaminase [Akkermansiaceae bacterium]MDB4513384.1 UDP-4-amino-4,6-dideoxy-N-acetyl-beta-L-altrosamine transaminase [Akkermansiaceae bacterium]